MRKLVITIASIVLVLISMSVSHPPPIPPKWKGTPLVPKDTTKNVRIPTKLLVGSVTSTIGTAEIRDATFARFLLRSTGLNSSTDLSWQNDAQQWVFRLRGSDDGFQFRNETSSTVPLFFSTTGAISFQNYTFPLPDGTLNQVLTTNGAGAVAWATPPGASGGEANTMSSAGSGFIINQAKSGVDLPIKSFTGGDGIDLDTTTSNQLNISSLWAAKDSTTTVILSDSSSDTLLTIKESSTKTSFTTQKSDGFDFSDTVTIGDAKISRITTATGSVGGWVSTARLDTLGTGATFLQIRHDSVYLYGNTYLFTDNSVADSLVMTKGFIQREIEDSLNEYSLTSAILALLEDSITTNSVFRLGHLSKAFFDTTTARVDPADSIIIAANAIGDVEIDWGIGLGTVSISDVPAPNWKYFFSDGTGAINAQGWGGSGSVLTSTGATSAPTWGSTIDTSLYLSNSAGGNQVVRWLGDSLILYDTTAGAADIHLKAYENLSVHADSIINGADRIGSFSGTGLTVTSNQLTADLGVDIALAEMQANSVDSTKIVDRSVGLTDLAQEGATSGQVLKWDGTDWNPGTDATSGGGSGAFDDITGDTARYIGPNADTALIVTSNGTGDTRITVGKESDGTATTLSVVVDTMLLGGSAYTNLAGTGLTLTAGALAADLGTSVDLTTEVTGTLPVANGGTGAITLTDGGILLGSGTGAVTALGAATNGQIPIGDGTTDPVLATITGGNGVTITNGAGTITASVAGRVKSIFTPAFDVGGASSAGPGDSAIVTLSTHDGQGSYVLYKDSSVAGAGTMTDTAYVSFILPTWCNTVDSVIFVYKGLSATANIAEISKVEVWGPDKSSASVVSDSSYFSDVTARNSVTASRIALGVTGGTQFAPGDPMTVMIETTLGATSVSVVYVYSVVAKGSE